MSPHVDETRPEYPPTFSAVPAEPRAQGGGPSGSFDAILATSGPTAPVLDVSYDRIARLAAAALQAPIGVVSLFKDGLHVVVGIHGIPGRARAWRTVPAARTASRQAIETQTPAQAETAGAAALAIPVGDRHRAALCVALFEPRHWTPLDVGLLEDLASLLRTELELRREAVLRHDDQDLLLHSALHDELTELPNRVMFTQRLQHVINRSLPDDEYLFAVLFLDLDRFKIVNDSLGHHAGDELLTAVAARLESAVRPEDTVARLGGDEFAVLLDGITSEGDAIHVAERIQATLATAINLGGYEVFTSASIGIVVGGGGAVGGERPEYLLRNADMAMYRAKSAGRATHAVFDRAMHRDALARLQLETELRHALERSELLLHYQPVISLATGRITGAEALLRWAHPERGLILPHELIPVAEDTGLILPIGLRVLALACRDALRWGNDPSITVAVNLSARQFAQPGLAQQVQEALVTSGLPAERLVIEITESAIIEHPESAAQVLTELRALGCRVYMDDFGTGYSSLNYLHRLPLDGIKIDRAFVSRMDEDPKAMQLVRTVITLAEGVGLETVAEGVATEGQLAELRRLRCTSGQGYLFSRVIDSAAMRELLAAGPVW
ncbi:MAG: putative bifunctional diguanylate cyclase/phosphodiesterase [Gemmatimonadaceae bacterium]